MRTQGLLLAVFLFSLFPGGMVAQFVDGQRPGVGQFLLATDKLGDPNFAEAVVLLIQYDADEGAVGLIINRRSEVPLSQVFPKKGAAEDPVFAGGPVDTRLVQALLRSPSKAGRATRLLDDVYTTGSKDEIEKSLRSHAAPSRFRVYLGYAGWEGGQLEAEIQFGAWFVLKASSKTIFDDDPDSLWERLNRQAHSQIASAAGKKLPAKAAHTNSALPATYAVKSPA